jgi:glyoxylase-like metal-dependent hydrolase (beta-lactamase superfamily II)
MLTLARGIGFIDLHFLNTPQVIGTAVFQGPHGVTLLDPGPSTCLDGLGRSLDTHGIGLRDIRAILLTHIHLDHAGATGTLVRANPDITVFVHERGAPHMIDPTKLLASATRLYGSDMDRLWGRVDPVPAANIRALTGHEHMTLSGSDTDREMLVAYTPGHASHHVSFFEPDSGLAFVGDTAGIHITGHSYVMPATPPPDIDLEAWADSARRVVAWQPRTLVLTHFGPTDRVATHFQELMQRIEDMSRLVRSLLARDVSDEARQQEFEDENGRALRREMPDADARKYEQGGPASYSYQGLARYWRKKARM